MVKRRIRSIYLDEACFYTSVELQLLFVKCVICMWFLLHFVIILGLSQMGICPTVWFDVGTAWFSFSW